jgi:hypothetical protein
MMDAFEVAGKIVHLPAFVCADLLAFDAAAVAGQCGDNARGIMPIPGVGIVLKDFC